MYFEPVLHCKAGRKPGGWCSRPIMLPCLALPEIDGDLWYLFENQEQEKAALPTKYWFGDSWPQSVACPECGQVSEYTAEDVGWSQSRDQGQSKVPSTKDWWRVEFGCSQGGCGSPIRFHTTGHASADIVYRKLKQGLFRGTASCGHSILVVPRERCKVERFT